MTQKQQIRAHGFGSRSLSVILALLMVLSTFAVMLTATSITANAAISYWQVAGDFNGWENSLSDAAYRISGGSGSVTIDISSDTYSSIQFKMVAEEGGGKWCGINSSSDPAQINADTESQLAWNSGNNIQINLPSGTTKVTFEIIVKNNNTNYVKVTPNGTGGGGGGGGDSGQMTYSAPVNKSNSANTADNLFWATASYFDYLSDEELSNTQWLKPVQAGTHNYGGAIDEWYPFYLFNREVVKAQADSQLDWAEPLYFGNFCDTTGAYDSPHHQNGYDWNGYNEATNDYNVTRFVHIANNSDYNQSGSAHVADMYTSYQGLVNSSLDSDGNLLLPNGQQAPYFNASEDGPLKGYAKVVNSSFPFKVTTYTDKKYKKYTFNSKDATDNVYFTWDTDGSVTYPTGVNYGSGTAYGVKDGVSRFMNGGTSGYGIFPFNNASGSYKGTKTNANENLNYGFGIKTQVKFRVPKPSSDVNTASDPIYFRFSGDDDLWMYITDEKGNSQLVLDMGGDHKESTGNVNFHNLTSTVDKVGTTGSSVTQSFDFDYDQTYTMTVFYMERGLIESNCVMEFTMTPLGNNFIVTEEINTVNVNPGLQDVVKQLSSFGFNPYESSSMLSDVEYRDFELGSGGMIQIPDTTLGINSKVKVLQYAPQNSYLVYDAVWDYYDNVSGKKLRSGTGVTSKGQTTTTSEQTLINESGNEYDYAELQVDYVNTPQVTDVSITKVVNDDSGTDHSDEEFPATVFLQFAANETPAAYDLDTSDGWAWGGRVTLQDGKTITINDVPVGTHVTVVESANAEYTVSYSDDIVAGTNNSLTVTNTPISPDAITGKVRGSKLLDDQPYTGNMFLFRLDGIAPMEGDPAGVIDTSDVYLSTNTVTNGEFVIDGLVFEKPGIYRYHVYEDLGALALIDAMNMNATVYAEDIYSFDTDYLVSITVTKQGTTLIAADPVYIPYSTYEDVIAQPDASGEPIPHVMTPDDFNAAPADSLQFLNYVQTGSVRVEKDDQAGNPVEGVTFAVYAVEDSFAARLNRSSDEAKYEMVKALTPVTTATTVTAAVADDSGAEYETGLAEIDDLPIYTEGYRATSNPQYQQYVMIELSGPEKYNVNKTVHVFSFPMEGDDGLQYHCTYKYVNGVLRSPSTAGAGMTLFKLFGWAIAGFSVLALGGYLLYTKTYARRKTAKNIAK